MDGDVLDTSERGGAETEDVESLVNVRPSGEYSMERVLMLQSKCWLSAAVRVFCHNTTSFHCYSNLFHPFTVNDIFLWECRF